VGDEKDGRKSGDGTISQDGFHDDGFEPMPRDLGFRAQTDGSI